MQKAIKQIIICALILRKGGIVGGIQASNNVIVTLSNLTKINNNIGREKKSIGAVELLRSSQLLLKNKAHISWNKADSVGAIRADTFSQVIMKQQSQIKKNKAHRKNGVGGISLMNNSNLQMHDSSNLGYNEGTLVGAVYVCHSSQLLLKDKSLISKNSGLGVSSVGGVIGHLKLKTQAISYMKHLSNNKGHLASDFYISKKELQK